MKLRRDGMRKNMTLDILLHMKQQKKKWTGNPWEGKKMIFLHDGIKYIAIRNTGNSDNYLALALSDKPCEIEFLPLDLNSTNPSITKNNIKKQVYEGVIHMQKKYKKKK